MFVYSSLFSLSVCESNNNRSSKMSQCSILQRWSKMTIIPVELWAHCSLLFQICQVNNLFSCVCVCACVSVFFSWSSALSLLFVLLPKISINTVNFMQVQVVNRSHRNHNSNRTKETNKKKNVPHNAQLKHNNQKNTTLWTNCPPFQRIKRTIGIVQLLV